MYNFVSYALLIGTGLKITILVTLASFCIGITLGTCFSIMQKIDFGKKIINCFIVITQSTPVILQLSIFYFAFPQIFHIKMSIITASIITFGLNSSAYITEILQCGIQNIPKGQFEAAQSLQVPTYYIWKDIIFPQVIQNILPALINELILILKETSIISIIGGKDIMRMSQLIAAEHFIYFTPLYITGIYYLILVILIQYFGKTFQRKELL